MREGARITLTKKIVSSLSGQDWDDIHRTLRQFGLPDEEGAWEDPEEYLFFYLEKGSDEAIADLEAYLHPRPGPLPALPEGAAGDSAAPWRTVGFRVFFILDGGNEQNAERLREAFGWHAMETFVASAAVEPSAADPAVIHAALATADAAMALLTPEFPDNTDCAEQVRQAAEHGLVLSLALGAEPFGVLTRFPVVTLRPRQQVPHVARTVFNLLCEHEATRAAMARALVARLESSGSPLEARSAIGALRRIPVEAWSDELLDRVAAAPERNAHIEDTRLATGRGPRVLAELVEGIRRERATVA